MPWQERGPVSGNSDTESRQLAAANKFVQVGDKANSRLMVVTCHLPIEAGHGAELPGLARVTEADGLLSDQPLAVRLHVHAPAANAYMLSVVKIVFHLSRRSKAHHCPLWSQGQGRGWRWRSGRAWTASRWAAPRRSCRTSGSRTCGRRCRRRARWPPCPRTSAAPSPGTCPPSPGSWRLATQSPP